MKNKQQMDLFSEKIDLRIAKINKYDVEVENDKSRQFKDVLKKHETMYPGIDKWFKNKVLPGIRDGERVAYLGYKNNDPIVSAVVKKGKIAKFCHLHIEEELRNNKLGELFFSMMSVDVRNKAKSVYFTLPESLWFDKQAFFSSFGFSDAKKSEIQYRSSEEELKSSTSFAELWKNVRDKLPKIISTIAPSNEDIFTGLLMSVKPKYIEKIKSGVKVVEIRKKFNHRWRGCRVTLYTSSPLQVICGHATIDSVVKGNPNDIWNMYELDIGGTKKEYDEYVDAATQIYAIKLKDYKSYHDILELNYLSHLIDRNLQPPQSYLSIENSREWTEAISLVELLHGRFQLYLSKI